MQFLRAYWPPKMKAKNGTPNLKKKKIKVYLDQLLCKSLYCLQKKYFYLFYCESLDKNRLLGHTVFAQLILQCRGSEHNKELLVWI